MDQDLYSKLLEKIRSYKMPSSALELLKKHKPLIITGVTASGKDAVAEYLENSTNWRRVINHTTRAPRDGEKNGDPYWFVTDQEMLGLLERQALIEAKTIHGKVIYGPSLAAYEDVIKSGHEPILRVDPQGVEGIGSYLPTIQAIFILPPSFDVWMERLGGRGVMSHVERSRRLRSAQTEIEKALKSRHFRFVVNHDIPSMAREILSQASDPAVQQSNRHLAQLLIEHAQAY